MPTLKYYDGAAYQQLPGMPGTPGPAGPTGPQGPPGLGVIASVSLRASRGSAYTIQTGTTIIPHDFSVWTPNAQYGPMQWDTQNAYNQSTGWYTVAVAGKYRATSAVWTTSTAVNQILQTSITVIRIATGDQRAWANGSSGPASAASQAMAAEATCTLDLQVGDQVGAFANALGGVTLPLLLDPRFVWFTMDLVSGAQGAIGPTGPTGAAGLAGTVVSVRAGRTAAITLQTAATQVIFDNDSQSPWGWDTQNAYNNSTGVFTAPVAGKYRITNQITWLSGAAGDWVSAQIYRNGTYVEQTFSGTSSASGIYMSAQAVDTLDLAVGDTITFYQGAGVSRSGLADIRTTFCTIDLLSGSGPQGVPGPTGPTGPAYAAGQLYSLVYYQTIPAPTLVSSPYTVRHNLGTTFPLVQLYDSVTLQQVMAQVRVVDANNVAISVVQNMPNPANVVIMGVAGSPVPINPGDLATKAYVDAKTPSLPAPVTSGSGIQSFTDALGDVWVAANGVRGGNWYRARDVLHAKYGRTTSYTYVQTTPTAIPFNAVVRDPYGLWASPSFVVPPGCGGLWRADAQLCIAFTAASQFIGMYINMGAASAVRTNIYSPAVINGYVHGHDCVAVNAGDNLQVLGYSGTASLVSAGNTSSDLYFSVKYEGTG